MVKKSKSKNPAKEQGKKIHIRLPEELHKKVRVKCAYEDLSIQSYVEKLIRENLEKYSVE